MPPPAGPGTGGGKGARRQATAALADATSVTGNGGGRPMTPILHEGPVVGDRFAVAAEEP